MSYVLVIDTYKKPVNPCHPGEVRKLFDEGKTAISCQRFLSILKNVVSAQDT